MSRRRQIGERPFTFRRRSDGRAGPRPHTGHGEHRGCRQVHEGEVEKFSQDAGLHKPAVDKAFVENATTPKWLVAVVRGDHDVNEAKLKRGRSRTASASDSFAAGKTHPKCAQAWSIGFVGPDAAVKALEAAVLVDPDAAQGGFWAAGANESDYHVKHFNWFQGMRAEASPIRSKVAVADIRNAAAGDPSPKGRWRQG